MADCTCCAGGRDAGAFHADQLRDRATAMFFGDGVPEDKAHAVRIFRQLAERGHVASTCNLAACYYSGAGVARDYAEAAKLYRRAALKGSFHAMRDLGVMLRMGDGVPRNSSEALHWTRMAADRGDADAQHDAAVCFVRSEGTAQDFDKAMYYFRKAEAQGHVEATAAIGTMYYKGDGVPRSSATAIRFWRAAAARGSAMAHYNLGSTFVGRKGFENFSRGIDHLRKAAKLGESHAIAALQKLGLPLEAPPLLTVACAVCGQPAYSRCMGCKRSEAPLYCSRDCQLKAWPAHKPHCGATLAKKQSSDEKRKHW